jgi:hypothetical protein
MDRQRRQHWLFGLALLTALGCAGALAPSQAGAQQNARTGSVRFDVHLDVGWYRFFAVGFRVDIPLVTEGIVSRIDDELALSLGAELAWFYTRNSDRLGAYPVLALQWNFYVDPKWSIFPELGIAFFFDPVHDTYYGAWIGPHAAFGVRYHFSARNALLLRAAWPGGFQVGITF